MKPEKTPIFTLNVSDIQSVALTEFDQELTDSEMEILKDYIGDYIPWYDCVLTAIHERVRKSEGLQPLI